MVPTSCERAGEKFNEGTAHAAAALSSAARAARRALGATKAEGSPQVAAVDWAALDIKGWAKHGAYICIQAEGERPSE
eukprot:1021911-Pleurochrysis_carterae.AAC.1